jgi:hypothetical protein
LWNDYDYSNEWKRFEEIMDKDLHDNEVFLFHHPKFSKKEYKRKYHMCPANGNARMVVGRMENPLDFAYVFFVLHSYFYNEPYIVLEDYKCISPNPDVIAEMVARAVNWVLKDFGVEIVLKRWDELVLYPIDFWVSYNKELRKSGGRNLIPMGYEGALKVHEAKEAKKKKADKKSDDICRYIKMPNPGLVLSWLHDVLKGRKTAKEISMPFRFILERVYPERIPYKAVVAEFPEVEAYLKQKRYDEWINKNNVVYNIDSIFEELQRSFEEYTGMNITNIIFKKRS